MLFRSARPGWIGYIAVDDVDASAGQITASGGTLFVPPTDIPGVGRFALAADPSGAPFYIMRGLSQSDSIVFSHEDPQIGLCGWNELCTPDQAGAWAFYSGLFGWVNDDEMDMGPMGKYQFIRHGFRVGAVMPFAADMGPPHWNFYFRVADIDAAKAKAEERGAQIIFGPMEVPGGEWVFQGFDPQGAHFCIVGAKS